MDCALSGNDQLQHFPELSRIPFLKKKKKTGQNFPEVEVMFYYTIFIKMEGKYLFLPNAYNRLEDLLIDKDKYSASL